MIHLNWLKGVQSGVQSGRMEKQWTTSVGISQHLGREGPVFQFQISPRRNADPPSVAMSLGEATLWHTSPKITCCVCRLKRNPFVGIYQQCCVQKHDNFSHQIIRNCESWNSEDTHVPGTIAIKGVHHWIKVKLKVCLEKQPFSSKILIT